MPLDGHSYLVGQGWTGKGTGLRKGAISRPLAIPLKKNLAGLGKDRDEAFPFWDHLFTAAASSIKVKCDSSDDDDADKADNEISSQNVTIKKTVTGIFSNRRPADGTPAGNINDVNLSYSLIASAKREAAKRGLYARFFRGPILGPDTMVEEEQRLKALDGGYSTVESVTMKTKTTDEKMLNDIKVLKRKRKTTRKDLREDEEDERAREERKRLKKKGKTTRIKDDLFTDPECVEENLDDKAESKRRKEKKRFKALKQEQ